MNQAEVKPAVNTLFAAMWDDPGDPGTPRTPWVAENRPQAAEHPEWVTVIVAELTSRQRTNGQHKIIERPCVLLVEINGAVGDGVARVDTLAQVVIEYFETTRRAVDLVFRTATKGDGRVVNGFWQVVVRIPFEYNEYK